jgi:hypothetical protein
LSASARRASCVHSNIANDIVVKWVEGGQFSSIKRRAAIGAYIDALFESEPTPRLRKAGQALIRRRPWQDASRMSASLFASLSSGVTSIPDRLAFCRGSSLTLCLFGSFCVAFSLFGFLDDFARGLVFRRAGFIGRPRGFAFGGAHIPRGNDRLPGGPPLGRALVDLGSQSAEFVQLGFFRGLGGVSALVKVGVLKNGHSLAPLFAQVVSLLAFVTFKALFPLNKAPLHAGLGENVKSARPNTPSATKRTDALSAL